MIIKKVFGSFKLLIGVTLFLSTVFAIIFELSTHYYFNKAEYLVFYEELPNVVKFFMNFSASIGAIITSLIAYYFYKSGLSEIKNKKPFILIVRIIVNSVPAVLLVYYSFIVFFTLISGQTENLTTWHFFVLPVLLPFLSFIFVREIFLDKFYKD